MLACYQRLWNKLVKETNLKFATSLQKSVLSLLVPVGVWYQLWEKILLISKLFKPTMLSAEEDSLSLNSASKTIQMRPKLLLLLYD